MRRIRTRLILAFLAATILPFLVTVWIMTSLLERSLSFATTEQLDRLSTSLQNTGRHYYQEARELLRQEAAAGSLNHQAFSKNDSAKWLIGKPLELLGNVFEGLFAPKLTPQQKREGEIATREREDIAADRKHELDFSHHLAALREKEQPRPPEHETDRKDRERER